MTSGRSEASRRLRKSVPFCLEGKRRGGAHYAPVRCISKLVEMWSRMKAFGACALSKVVQDEGEDTHRDLLGR